MYNIFMLSVFPELLNYSQLSPFILRMALAVILLRFGYACLKRPDVYKKTTGAIKIVSAILLAIGMLTQIAALAVSLLIITTSIKRKIETGRVDGKALRFLILASSMALLFMGPGLFSIDLPF